VLTFARFLDSIGAGVERHWERVGLSPRALSDPERLVPLHLAARFIEDGARGQGIEDLGLRAGAGASLASLGRFGDAIRAAGTLGRAFGTARDTVAAHNSAASYWVVREGDSARVCRRLRDPGGTSRQIDLFTVTLLVQLVRLAAGDAWRPSRIELQSAGPLVLREPGVIGDAVVSVGAPVTSVELPRHLLGQPLAPQDAPGSRAPVVLADWLASAPPRDFLGSIETLVSGLLEARHADVTTAADAAAMTVRSLQRRLAECGTSYSAVLDRVRCRTALQLIEQPEVKLIEVALAVGYSDPAHFTRAFRRWTSVSPIQYRRVLLRDEDAARRSA